MPHLSPPTTAVHASYCAAVREYQGEEGHPDVDDLNIDTPRAFADHVNALRHDPRTGAARISAPMTLYWWIHGPTYLGRISIWHHLNADLVLTGHIGYDIRPTARHQGHATAMLAAALPCAYALGIDPAILTTHTGNHASHAVIHHNGGRIIDRRGNRIYYEVPTTPPSVTSGLRPPRPAASETPLRFWEDQPELPYATMLSIIETYCHPSSWEGADAQLRTLAQISNDPTMSVFKSQLATTVLDPTVLKPRALFEAAEYSDGHPQAFVKNLWARLYPEEDPARDHQADQPPECGFDN